MHSELLSSWDKKAKPRDPAILIHCLWERMQSQSNHIFFSPCFQCDLERETSYPATAVVIYHCTFNWAVGNCLWQQKRFSYNCFSHSTLLLLMSQGKTVQAFFLHFPFWPVCWSIISVPNELLIFSFAVLHLAILQVIPTPSKKMYLC